MSCEDVTSRLTLSTGGFGAHDIVVFLLPKNMEESKPSYYANIPATVRYCEGLPAGAKLLYGEITALCNKEGFCWASNKYFAELYRVTSGTISEWVKLLRDKDFITCEITGYNLRKIFLSNGYRENPGRGQ